MKRESFVKDGKLYEQYRVYQNQNVKPRNRTEQFMINEIKSTLQSPIHCTIEDLHNSLQNVLSDHIKWNRNHGICSISDINISSTIADHDNWQTRGFSLYGPRRGTYTISVSETVTKIANNSYLPVPLNLYKYNDYIIIS